MVTKEMKNVFLSASIPLPERDPKYIETSDVFAIRDAIIALATVVLPNHRIIWGGHPSITPLVYYVMKKLDRDIRNHVKLYQSAFFQDFFPEDNNQFDNVIITDIINGNKDASLKYMREKMFQENEFSAAIFIGGMEGVEIEYQMFKEKQPNALLLPIASTGAATKIIYETLLPEQNKNIRLTKDYGYMSLFQKLLIDEI